MALRKGFKAEAEELAEGIRSELGIGNLAPLNAFFLLQHLEIPSLSLTALAGVSADSSLAESIGAMQDESSSSLSAMTVFRGSRRLVVFNDGHSAERQASDVCHEASHGILLHAPAPVLDAIGCRAWDSDIEDEAQFLAGALLVPGKGARYYAKAGWSHEATAAHFGCSVEMARWRHNMSGGARLAKRVTASRSGTRR